MLASLLTTLTHLRADDYKHMRAHDHQAVTGPRATDPPEHWTALSAAAARSMEAQDERQWLGISLTTSNLADLRKLTYNHRRRSYDPTEVGYAMTPEQKARVVCE